MKYGFIIDNRKCIGCHACTTACKSEHQIPVGVNRTWVKQVEKGEFPNTRRLFSVMRCNHCTDAPCVEICPTESLFFRKDGIVDFDKDRCIGCKSCMQACPYDALYIDPETSTAAKCNYCAHRIDVGLEPACVNVCPEEAIISGDMDNPTSKISELLAQQSVKARKVEKGTQPNLFYIDADDVSILSTSTDRNGEYLWSQQATGVGHFAKEAEKLAFSNGDAIDAVLSINDQYSTAEEVANKGQRKSVEVLMGKEARRVYDTPDKGILWGWEVSAYVFTKAIAAGVYLVMLPAAMFEYLNEISFASKSSLYISLFFLSLTGLLLIKDLDQPKRFLYVLFRPHWKSWLVKGGYLISLFGILITSIIICEWFDIGKGNIIYPILLTSAWLTGIGVAIYTAFLFAQAKGRDFWQSPILSIHMLVHSFMAGAAVFVLMLWYQPNGVSDASWTFYLKQIMWIGIIINLFSMLIELATPHPTSDAKYVVNMILKGRYKKMFWLGVLILGNIIPFILLLFAFENSLIIGIAGGLVLIGIYLVNHIWVEAPQRITLS